MANTPNIDLVKPAGTDHAMVSVLNSNSDKIDSFAGSTNAAIATYNFGVHTISDLETAFASYASNMANGQFKNVIFTVSTASGIWATSSYYGTIRRDSSGRYNMFAQPMNGVAPIVTGNYMSGSWSWAELAVNSTKINTNLDFTIASGNENTWVNVGSVTIPAKSEYLIRFWARFVNTEPSGIRITTSSEAYSAYLTLSGNDAFAGTCLCGFNNNTSALTVYVWVRYKASGSNRVEVNGTTRQLS